MINHIEYLYYSFCIIFSASIGALLPDADSEGKSKLYYKYRAIYYLMILIYDIIVLFFNNQKIKEKLKIGYNIKKQHRGILHTPIGVFLSSLLLTAIFSLIYITFSIYLGISIDFLIVLSIFIGLFFGQIMHLIEDSFTVSGINWLFPFGNKIINGKIYTFGKDGKVDIRPELYTWFYTVTGFAILGIVMFFSNTLPSDKIFGIIGMGMVINTISLIGLYFISNSDRNLWLVDRKNWKRMQKSFKSKTNYKNLKKYNKSRKRRKSYKNK
ncbi:hypothetical protein JH146_0290 [Methanocaldococcus bathoardescens]|uniref:Membrane-bound metal-dependent hydrolase n=2 Tax=Methanocaldococcus bathoardescens TaxID=1301915 RepID=A0A076LAD5_9EURY|nr:hypothetical protein JH146_0290 [Methanocaldococcus bathoardescens]